MLYIVPAWYSGNRWSENEQFWYRPRTQTEMDDTVKQIQLFDRQSIDDYKVLILGFAPNFRHFLHRQSIFHAPYWSCFDAMQCIEGKHQVVFSFHDMDWPEGIEFIYSHFAVIAMLHGEKHAIIEFGDDGNLIQIDRFENGKLSKRLKFDDRGFIGSMTTFVDGEAEREFFLDPTGTWKFCLLPNGHVNINQKSAYYRIDNGEEVRRFRYSRASYSSIDLMIQEVFSRYIQEVSDDAAFCLAMHPLHTGVLNETLRGKKTILSFWNSRELPEADASMSELLDNAHYLIADMEEEFESLEQKYGTLSANRMEISPYDVRVDLGTSRQINEQRVLIATDSISDDILSEIVVVCARYSQENPSVRFHLFTRNASFQIKGQILLKVQGMLQSNGFNPNIAALPDVQDSQSGNGSDENVERVFVVDQCIDEMSINKCLRNIYLMVDLAATPDLFLQIESVSMCIPQIAKTSSRFTEDGGNATVVSNSEQLEKAFHYYLDNLGNWNAAMVHSYEMGQRFTTSDLINRWKKVLGYDGSN